MRFFFVLFFAFYVSFMIKKHEKIKKMQKKCKKICTYQKKVLPLHRIKKTTPKKKQKRRPNYEQKVLHKQPRRDYP